ncbi:hypothetical protein BD324DRAFT_616940 [Kockovaella imperatae]|uniref:Translation machinery-associated protein 16 n=1 Tax=Kockovaella imperatae TaxID=4999 RepID=A0A1Y1UQE7_9TREE|nr:hypothetical protein BD324DRAFT_616940 [Kockovaella imperatae]ORX40219.1 hypothetical protein BD324DRAFT_616940 [Kockovaella imperatae]
MPGNRRLTKKTIKGKDNLHPSSRKAGQLQRVHLRAAKLDHRAKIRQSISSQKLERPLFFLHSLPSSHPLSLPALRELITDVYLARHDARISELEGQRRSGRPKDKELIDLEEIKKREQAEWETGIEVPDLTHGPTVKILFGLQDSSTSLQQSHLDLLRHIRLFKDDPDTVLVTREGKWDKMGFGVEEGQEPRGSDVVMDA